MIGVSEDIINKYNYRTKCKMYRVTKYLGDDAPEEYNDDFADNIGACFQKRK